MKKTALTMCLIFTMVLQLSCKKKEKSPVPYNPNNWTLGAYTYGRDKSTQNHSTLDNGDTLHVISTSTSSDGSVHGAFSGSGLGCSFIDLGEGDYEVTSPDTAIANPTVKYIYFSCMIGTAGGTGSTRYTSQPSTVKASVTKVNAQYHVTITTPVTFRRSLVINGGVAGAADAYTFTCNDVY